MSSNERADGINGITAFIFDMDGTLIESTKIDYDSWVELFTDHNKEFMSFDEYKKLLGVKSVDVIKEYLGLEGDAMHEALQQRLRYIKKIFATEGLKTVPHAEKFLEDTKASFKMALATGARFEKLAAVLEKIDLRKYFEVIVTADDVHKGKPDPALFLEAARRLGIDPSQAIVVEDAENGVLAAKAAGMKCIAITTTTPVNDLSQADMIFDSYNEIDPLRIAEKLGNKGSR